MMIKVSVIVPIYNAEKYLYQCLETILGQTLREIEVILIDDGSTDSSYQICQEFSKRDKRIRLYRQKNKGVGITRNRGIKLAQGEYLSFLDSDDFFELEMLQTLYRRAKATDSDVTFCDYLEFDNIEKQDKKTQGIRYDLMPKKAWAKSYFCAADCPDSIFLITTSAAWSSIYRKSFVLENDLQFGTCGRAEDVVFSGSALILAKKISWVNQKLLHYRVNIRQSLSECADNHLGAPLEAYQRLYGLLMKRGLYTVYKKSFLDALTWASICYEICKLKYPQRFLSESVFVEKIVPEYGLDILTEDDFYDKNLYVRLKECIYSKGSLKSLCRWIKERRGKIIPIVLATNEAMSLACAVTIQSIIEHASPDYLYDIYILYTDLSECMKCRFKDMNSENIHLTPVYMKDYITNISYVNPKLAHITSETYLRFFIPSILSYDKVLYLDSDLVLQKDIASLYRIELGNNLIAGVVDILSQEEEEEKKSYDLEPLAHINAGVLLINNKLWKEEKIQEQLENECLKPSYSWTLNDQDIINFICKDRILLLNSKWNFLYAAFRWKKDKYTLRMETINPIEYNIIHYNGREKPWNSSGNSLLDIWWKYAKKCPFYHDVLRQYIQCTSGSFSSAKQSSLASPPPPKKTFLKLTEDEIYQLRKAYVKKALKYWFSFGQKKKGYKLELEMIIQRLREGRQCNH